MGEGVGAGGRGLTLDAAPTLAPHGRHGDGGAGHRGVLGLPLGCDGLDLSVELDALVAAKENCGVSSTATVSKRFHETFCDVPPYGYV